MLRVRFALWFGVPFLATWGVFLAVIGGIARDYPGRQGGWRAPTTGSAVVDAFVIAVLLSLTFGGTGVGLRHVLARSGFMEERPVARR